jgi:signal transduction histidine kinase
MSESRTAGRRTGAVGRAAAAAARPARLSLMQWLLLVVGAVAAACAACLGWRGEIEVREAVRVGALRHYENVLRGVLVAPPLPPGEMGAADPVSALTRFDEVSPFVVSPAGEIGGVRDEAIRAALAAALESGKDGARLDPATGTGLVWSTPREGGATVGLSFSPRDDPRFAQIAISVVLSAAFASALLSMWLGVRARDTIAARAGAIDAQPQAISTPELPAISRELAALDPEIAAVGERHLALLEELESEVARRNSSRSEKARVFAGMSHDLRSPLNSVIGFTELLLKGIDGKLTDDQRRAVSVVARESERLLVRIGDILDTAKIEAGRFELERSWVPSVEILTECAAGASRLVAEEEVSFEREFQPGLPPVRVDKERVIQAILSLVARAVESASKAGTIRLVAARLAESERWPRGGLEVRILDDDGVISPRRLEVVARAWRAAEGGETDWPERGAIPAALGLSLARSIVELHGGEVRIGADESAAALFTVTLPLDSDAGGA